MIATDSIKQNLHFLICSNIYVVSLSIAAYSQADVQRE